MPERTHPIKILSNLWRVLYLIIIPILRSFVLALQGDLIAWLSGAWVDVLVLLLMTAVAVLRWNALRYSCDSYSIYLRSGVIFRREIFVPWDKVATVSVIEPFYLRPFRAAVLRVDTLGGNRRGADLSLFLNRVKAEEILTGTKPDKKETPTDSIGRAYMPGTASVLSLSVLNSNSLAGIIFIATFVSQSGKLLGNEFSNMILYTFEDIARTLAFGIPPAAAAIAYALLGGWLAGFLVTFINYRNFKVSRSGILIYVSGGATTLRKHSISREKISFIEIRQSVAAIFFKLYSLYIYAPGYGKHKDDIACVIPAEKAKPFTLSKDMLFPEFTFSEPDNKAPEGGIFRFVSQPLILLATVGAAMVVLTRLFPLWDSFILFSGFMLMIPCVLFLIVRVIIFKTGGIAKSDNCYTLRYSSPFSIRTVIIPEDKIALVKTTQNFFQKRGKNPTCDVAVYTTAEGKHRHVCRSIAFDKFY